MTKEAFAMSKETLRKRILKAVLPYWDYTPEKPSRKKPQPDIFWKYMRAKDRNPLALAEELARTEGDVDSMSPAEWRNAWKAFLILMAVIYSFFVYAFIFFLPLLEAMYAAGGDMLLFFMIAITMNTFLWLTLISIPSAIALPPLQATPSRLRRLDAAYLAIGVARLLSTFVLVVLFCLCVVFFVGIDPWFGIIVGGAGLVNGLLLFFPFGFWTERFRFCQSCQKTRKFYWRPGGRRCGACGWRLQPGVDTPVAPRNT